MKTATKRADELKALHKKISKGIKVEPLKKLEPLDALVRGAMSYDVSDERATSAMDAISKEFVDLNELRVATDLEIQELLGVKYPHIRQRVELITRTLNVIFEKEHTLSLDRLKTISKRDARQVLRELPDMHPFVEAYVMLFSFDANAVPIDDIGADYLEKHGIIDPETSLTEAQKFVEHHVKAEESHGFYHVLRHVSHSESDGKKKTPRAR